MKRFILFLLLIMLLLVGCSKSENFDGGSSELGNNNVVVETTRKIYYTVNISLDCENVNNTIDIINSKVQELNGYMSNSTLEDDYGFVVFRVKTEKLDVFLDYLDSTFTSSITRKSISSTDITTSYNKAQARLEVLNASRLAYLEALKKATTMADIIAINTRIEEIDSEILELDYELSSYDNLIDYSTIKVSLNMVEKDNFFMNYLVYLGNVFKYIGIAILYLLPFGAIGGGITLLVLKLDKHKKKIKKDAEKNN